MGSLGDYIWESCGILDLRFHPFIIPNLCESEVFELRAAAAAVVPSGFGLHFGVVSNRTWQPKTC